MKSNDSQALNSRSALDLDADAEAVRDVLSRATESKPNQA